MFTDRRTFFQMAAATGASICLPENLEAQAPTPTRVSVTTLAPNHPTMVTFRNGVANLKARPPTDPLNWSKLADIHNNFCPHGNWFFLPWHRAYLVMYEKIIRHVTGDMTFALPYWDWTTDRQLPAAFAQPTFNGQPNALFEPSRTISPTYSLPNHIVGPAVITNILQATNFEIFASSMPAGQNSTGTNWQRSGGTYGPLESNPHNSIHGIVGGIMGSFTSPIDPVFMLHHGNIDRLWAVWNHRCGKNTTSALWTGFTFVNNFRNTSGGNYSTTVASQASTVNNGYRYGLGPRVLCSPINIGLVNAIDIVSQVQRQIVIPPVPPIPPVTPVPPIPPRPDPRSPARFSGQLRNLNLSGVNARVVNATTAAPMSVLTMPVKVDAANIRRAIQPGANAGAGSTFDLAREVSQARTPARTIAIISEIVPPAVEETEVRIFMNCDYLSSETSTNDPHYVGSFSYFATGGDHAGHAGHNKSLSMIFDVTESLQRLQRNGRLQEDQIRFQLIPVALPGVANAKVAPLMVGKIELATI